jgi:hypothetical protein
MLVMLVMWRGLRYFVFLHEQLFFGLFLCRGGAWARHAVNVVVGVV